MSKLLLLLLLAVLAQPATAQLHQASVKLPLTHVTVYLDGTALEHQGSLPLLAGLNRVVVSGLSSDFDGKNAEAQLGEGAELVALGDDNAFDNEDAAEPEPMSKADTDSLTRALARLHRAEAELLGLQQEKTFLLANQVLPAGTQANWSAEVLKGAALMRTRVAANQLETQALTARLTQLGAEVAAWRNPRPKTPALEPGQAVLLVRAARPGAVALTLRYHLGGRTPTWSPKLDIRVDAAGRKMDFVTHGQLRNRTRLNWQRVRLSLVRLPMVEDVSRPTMDPWELSFNGNGSSGEGRVDAFVVKGTAKGQPAEVAQGTRYDVPEPITLSAYGRRDLALPPVALPSRPEYLAIPRLSESVFIQAKVAGWEGLQLPDRADVFRQGLLVGDTRLEPEAYNDSLEIALGHDEQLVVGRAKLEDFSGNAGLGDKRRVRLRYELNVRNRHPEPVRLRLLDQIPISEEKEIVVKLLDASGAVLDEATGKLTWQLTLPAGASQRLQFAFQVDYPKNQKVEIINHRVKISSPKFR